MAACFQSRRIPGLIPSDLVLSRVVPSPRGVSSGLRRVALYLQYLLVSKLIFQGEARGRRRCRSLLVSLYPQGLSAISASS